MGAPGGAVGATVYVDDSFASDNASAHEWTTVAEGVLDAAPGDTVFVHNGTYNETLTVSNASVTIQGESRAGVRINGPQFGSASVITVSADRITIQNLTTSGSSYGVSATVSGSSNGTIDNVSVLDARQDCILIQRASNWTIHDTMARQCSQVGSNGITLSGPGGGGHRLWSIFFNNTNGIAFAVISLDGVIATNLTFTNPGATAILLQNASNVQVSGFAISTSSFSGAAVRLASDTRACAFSNGTISSTSTFALQVQDTDRCLLDNITVASGSYGGINLIGGSSHWTWRSVSINLTTRALLFNTTLPPRLDEFEHDIDTSNVIAGVPIIYFLNASGASYTGPASFFAAVNSTGLEVSFTTTLNKAGGGSLVFATNNSRFYGLNSSGNAWNLLVFDSNGNQFFQFNQTNNGTAAELGGIVLYRSTNNTFEGGHWNNGARLGIALDARNDTASHGNSVLNVSCTRWRDCFFFGNGSAGSLVANVAVTGADTGVYANRAASIIVRGSSFVSLLSYGVFINGVWSAANASALISTSIFNGSGSVTGVSVVGHNTTRIENCSFDYVNQGVSLGGVHGGAIVDSTVYHAADNAIAAGGSEFVLLQRITVWYANSSGVSLILSKSFTLRSVSLTNFSVPIRIGFYADQGFYALHDADVSNTINGVPLLWIVNATGGVWAGTYSWLVLANCSNVSVRLSGVQSGADAGVILVDTNDSWIDSPNAIGNYRGIAVYASRGNRVSNGHMLENRNEAVYFEMSSDNTVNSSVLRPSPLGSYYAFVLDTGSFNDTLDSSDCAEFYYCAHTWIGTGFLRVTNSTLRDTMVGIRSTALNGPTITGNTFINASDHHILIGNADYQFITGIRISNNTFNTAGRAAIFCSQCFAAEISDNLITGAEYGIDFELGYAGTPRGTVVARNNITNMTAACIAAGTVDALVLLNNTFSGCQNAGLEMRQSRAWTLRGNIFVNQTSPFLMLVFAATDFTPQMHDVDASNIANGFPIRYWVNASDVTFSGSAGLVIAVNCQRLNITLNNTVTMAYSPLALYATRNSVFRNVTGAGNLYGILLLSSDNNSFINLSISGSVYGGIATESDGNRFVGGSMAGIDPSQTSGLNFQGNSNLFDSVTFYDFRFALTISGASNRVQGARFEGCPDALTLWAGGGNRVLNVTFINGTGGNDLMVSFSSGNLLQGNTFGGAANAIVFEGSTSNVVVENNFSNVTTFFLWFDSNSGANVVYHNNFYATSLRIFDASALNKYDNGYPSGGNFWSSFAVVDRYRGPTQNLTGPDGLSDQSLLVVGTRYDAFPLAGPWPPHLLLVSPPPASLIGVGGEIRFNISSYFDSVRYSINNGTLQNFSSRWNISSANFSNGDVFVRVVASDPWYNLTRAYLFTFDGTRPSIAAVTAPNGSVIVAGTVLSFAVTDARLADNATWTLGGNTQPLPAPFTIDTTNWTEGVYVLSLRAWDLAGNREVAVFVYIVDPTLPLIPAPAWDGGYFDAGTVLTVSALDPLLAWVSWSWDANPGANVSGPNASVNTAGWSEGAHSIQVVAGDRGGHITRANFSLTIDSIAPQVAWVSPANGSRVRADGLLEFSATDANLARTEWSLGEAAAVPTDSPSSIDTSGLADGLHHVTLFALDLAGHVTQLTLTIIVDGTPPALPSLPVTRTDEVGTAAVYDARGASDPDGALPPDAFEWTFGSGPAAVTRTGALATMVWPAVGTYDVRLAIRDALGNENSTVISVRVVDTTAPSLSYTSPSWVNEGAAAVFDASGSRDNEPSNATALTVTWGFDYQGSPRILTGAIATFVFAVPGIYKVVLAVTDAHGNANISHFDFRVNDVPSVLVLPPISMRLPGTYDAALDVVDADRGDTHNVTAASPPGFTVSGTAGHLSLHFTPSAAGAYPVNISISDGWSTYYLVFILNVTLNSPPVFGPGLPQSIGVTKGSNATVPLSPVVIDADDGSNLTFTVTSSNPSVVTAAIERTADGFILRVVGHGEGQATLTLTVTDPFGGQTTQAITVDVIPPPSNVGGELAGILILGLLGAASVMGFFLWRRTRKHD